MKKLLLLLITVLFIFVSCDTQTQHNTSAIDEQDHTEKKPAAVK